MSRSSDAFERGEVALPQHLALIMDGNGRWANAQGADRAVGHRVGSEVVNQIVRCCRRWGLRYLTLYAFSEQNWGRPEEEVSALMELLVDYLMEQRATILEERIRLRAIGDLKKLPEWVQAPLHALIAESEEAGGMTLTLALSYGGREEIVDATRSIARAVERGELTADAINAEELERRLYEPSLPPVDLVLRTSGEQRLSNFLLWQSAYAELDFIPEPWPEFDEDRLKSALLRFASRERRFGLTGAQARSKT